MLCLKVQSISKLVGKNPWSWAKYNQTSWKLVKHLGEFKRKLSAINKVQLSSCVSGQSSFPLDGHLAFSEQAVSSEFPPLSRCLLTLQLCFALILFTPSKLTGFVHSCHSASSGFANAYMQCYMQCTNTFFKEDVKTSFGSFSAVSNYRYIINESDIYLS